MTGFAGIDIPCDAGFAGMDAADDFALSAVFYFAGWFGFHLLMGSDGEGQESIRSLGMQIQRTT